jgi:methylene-tetrahydromethanopterin dehydrogenase
MKTLEVTPLEGKRLKVIIIEKEYNEPLDFEEAQNEENKRFLPILKPSIAFCRFLEQLINEVNPDFATEELGNRSINDFTENNGIAGIFYKKKIPLFAVDIDENAKSYLLSNINEKEELLNIMLKHLKEPQTEGSYEREYLTAYAQCLRQEIEEIKNEIKFSIRESWIAMGILDKAREINKENMVCIHISSPEHTDGVKKILESVDVEVETIQLEKKLIAKETSKTLLGLEELLESSKIQIKPLIRRSRESRPYIIFFLDTDEKASPFDICMAYDAGYNVVVPYENVTPEDVKRIVQDAIFSRDPKGIKHTCFFIGGKNVERAEEVLEVVKKTMFPPFQTNIIVDPGGAYTTASAMVAKVEEALEEHNLGELSTKTCAIFGTGAVGRVAAILLARLGCDVIIASINPERKDGEEYAQGFSKTFREKYGVKVEGAFAPTPEKKLEIIEKSDIIFCAPKAGVQVITKEMLKEVKRLKVIADVNAVPPFGVEGIKPNDDMREIAPGIFGIGALTIGKLKHKVEEEMLKEARISSKGEIYDYNYAIQVARRILREKAIASRLTVTLNYPRKS